MIWPEQTGSLCARMSRGLNGQDANGMLVVTSPAKGSATMYGGGVSKALATRDYKGGCEDLVVSPQYVVRRLTPLECCRLQGFPDYWTDGVPGSDSAQYKMWGNGMALPCMLYVLQGIQEEADP